jgi:dethiobiotin synthetase
MGFVLVTGTGSGVGKTWVTRALARTLTRAGQRVIAVKPVEVGDTIPGGTPDGELLAAATGQEEPRAALVHYHDPLPPALAAERHGDPVDIDVLLLQLEPLRPQADVILMEGTGGLLDPITWEWNEVELARSLGAGVLVVGNDRLGTINHTLLTLGALELGGVGVLGVVLTGAAEPDVSTGANAPAIVRLSGLDRVTAAPYQPDPFVAAEWDALAEVAGWVMNPVPEIPPH